VRAIIFDPAHGNNVAGKRSPDGELLEWKWSREIIYKTIPLLKASGISCYITNTEDYEIGLRERVRICNSIKENKKLLISIHLNGAGDGTKWCNARGFEVWTTIGEKKCDFFARKFIEKYKEVFPDLKNRGAKEMNFTVLTCDCPAVLLEIAFQDNKEDKEMVMNNEFKNKLIHDFLYPVLYDIATKIY